MQRLGFHPDDGGILIRGRSLDPLGHPTAKGPKYFSADYIEELAHDENWLSRASDLVAMHHREANGTPDEEQRQCKNTKRSHRRGRGAADLDESGMDGKEP